MMWLEVSAAPASQVLSFSLSVALWKSSGSFLPRGLWGGIRTQAVPRAVVHRHSNWDEVANPDASLSFLREEKCPSMVALGIYEWPPCWAPEPGCVRETE